MEVSSEATAREIEADMNAARIRREGSVWERVGLWLTGAGKTMLELDRALGPVVVTVSALALSVIAAVAWFNAVGGGLIGLVMGAIAVFAVLFLARMAGSIWENVKERDWGELGLHGVLILVIVGGNIFASANMQATRSLETETGRTDIQAQIDALQAEQTRLSIALMQAPRLVVEQQEAALAAFLAARTVNLEGRVTDLTHRQVLADCTTYRTLCSVIEPVSLELQGKVAEARAIEADTAQLQAIPGQIAELRAQRPAAPGMASKIQRVLNTTADNALIIWYASMMAFAEAFLIGSAFVTGARSYRRKQKQKQEAVA